MTPMQHARRTRTLIEAWRLDLRGEVHALLSLLEGCYEEACADADLGVLLFAAYMLLHRYPEAREVRERIGPALEGRADRTGLRFRNLSGALLIQQGDISAAADVFDEVVALATESGDLASLSAALHEKATVAFIRCEYAETLLAIERSLVLAKKGESRVKIGTLYHNLGVTYIDLGLYHHASRNLDRALEYLGSPAMIACNHQERAHLNVLCGDYRKARFFVGRSLESFRTLGLPAWVGVSLSLTARIEAETGDQDAAELLIRDAEAAAPGDDPWRALQIHEEAAAVALRAGDEARTGRALAFALECCSKLGAPARADRLRTRLAAIRIEMGWGCS